MAPLARASKSGRFHARETYVDIVQEYDVVFKLILQSVDPDMPLRMAEYCLRVRRNFRKFPQQILVYLGNVPLTMGNELKGPKLSYSYRIVDIRDLDGERLLASPEVGR
jgi:hypothetical protein